MGGGPGLVLFRFYFATGACSEPGRGALEMSSPVALIVKCVASDGWTSDRRSFWQKASRVHDPSVASPTGGPTQWSASSFVSAAERYSSASCTKW